MSQTPTTPLQSGWRALIGRCIQWFAGVPVTAWVVAGLFLIGALFYGLHNARKDSTLRLKVQHNFRSAQLTVWVDGSTAYSSRLTGYAKKKFGLIPDSIQGSLSDSIAINSGKHQLRVRVAADDGSVEEDTISGEFASNSQRTLSVSAHRGQVGLNWQGTGAAAEPADSGSTKLGSYAGTLLLTAAGSIVSALTGYAIKELPNYVRTRQANTPKA